jgi:uncharacterized membrane protein YGL010W
MKTAQQWFDEYGESHQNKTNKTIHWICVPAIFFSSVGLFMAIPAEYFGHEYVNWATIVIALGLIYYLRLSLSLFLGMAAISAGSYFGAREIAYDGREHLVTVCATIFVVAWAGQFIGHTIEGKKPSFFKDLQFLLVGPAWLLHFVYRKVGIPI